MKILNVLALTIAIIGAVNWGLIGAFDFNLVDMLFGAGSMFSKFIYVLVGIVSHPVVSASLQRLKAARSGISLAFLLIRAKSA